MDTKLKNRLKRTAILAGIALVIGAGLGLMEARKDMRIGQVKTHKVAGIGLGGDFSLIDYNGVAVTQDDYKQSYKLVFFGFTSCPMICPVEMQKMTEALTSLEGTHPDVLKKLQPLFITTDPARDTPEVMKEYTAMFYPKIIGLTGSKEQVDAAIATYRVFAQKVENENTTSDAMDYDMDHSAYTYLMSPDNELISIYRMEDSADYMANDIAGKI